MWLNKDCAIVSDPTLSPKETILKLRFLSIFLYKTALKPLSILSFEISGKSKNCPLNFTDFKKKESKKFYESVRLKKKIKKNYQKLEEIY